MNSDVEVNIKLSDNGSAKALTKDTDKYNDSLERAERIAQKINKAKAAGYKAAGTDTGEGREFGVARAAVGTGAAGRDFAKQAQGLGGLVHVYATFAANLFAVGAAFRALSEAADTTNMIRGMDQLGAAQGKSLGTIAKNLVEVTDGAISFREAIEATTKGAAAGLSSTQMKQMAEVAKKASQSLGIAMPDALSRLSRGISKLEPELLDELGLYTKIEKATQDYARTIGKTATSLTDFEKRQAFANAVLKEGMDKFAAIEMSANPYDKLLASLKNVGQQSLELVNTALTPLVTLLAASPTGLMATLAGIGIVLLKQAIPALGHYRESLAATAEASRLTFIKIFKDQQTALQDTMIRSAEVAEAAYRSSSKVSNQVKGLAESAKEFSSTTKRDWAALAAKNPFEMTDAEIKSLENRAKTLSRTNAAEAEIMRAHVRDIKKLRLEAVQAGETASHGVEMGAVGAGPFTTVGANEIIYRRQMNDAVASSIKSAVAETQAIYGARAAFIVLGEELVLARAGMQKVKVGVDEAGNAIMETAPKMGKLKAATTGLSAAFGIVATKIGTTLNALNPWLIGIGLAIEAMSLFDGWMTKTAKQQEAFGKALSAVSDAVDNVARTVDQLNKKGIAEAATISGIFALSNAMLELTNSTEIAVDTQKKLKDALSGSWWDRAKNNILRIFGSDIDTKLAESMEASLQASLKIFEKSGQYSEAATAFKEALGIQSLDTDNIVKAFKNSTDAQEKFQEVQKKLNATLSTSNSRLQAFKSSTENSTKAYQEFIQSTANNNPLFKLGASLEDVAMSMQAVLGGGLKEVNAAFDDLTKHPEKFALFGQAFAEQFVNIRQEFKDTFEAEQEYMKKVSALDSQMAEKQQKLAESRARVEENPQYAKMEEALQSRYGAELKGIYSDQTKLVKPDTSVYEQVTKIFTDGVKVAFEKGSDLIAKALGQASDKAAIAIAQAKLGGLTGEQAAIESNRLKQQELGLQLNAINTNIDLIRSQEELKATIDLSNAIAQASDIKGKSAKQIELDQANLTAAATYKNILSGKGKLTDVDTGNEQANAILKLKLMSVQRATAQQEAAATIVKGQMSAEQIAAQRAIRAGQLQDLEKINQLTGEISQQEVNRLNIYQSIAGAATVETQQRIIALEKETMETKQAAERQAAQNAIQNAIDSGNQKEIDKQTQYLALVIKRQDAEKDNKGIQDRNKLLDIQFATESKLRELRQAQVDLVLKGVGDEISANQENLSIRTSLGMITAEDAEKEKNRLARQALLNDYLKQEIKLQADKKSVLEELALREAKAAGGTPDQLAALAAERDLKERNFGIEEANLIRIKQLKLGNMDLDQSMGEKFRGFSQIVEKGFTDMADALTNFVTTGKLDFKGLINSMLADLIRFELRAQMSALYTSMGGLAGMLGMGFTNPNSSAYFNTQYAGYANTGPMGLVYAKGGAFDGGIEKFAKGGAFSNSVVNSPTLFKFAKGTGMMGEAGPEAIMPLKRDANGNLGVRAGSQGGNTSVVVNNYGSEKATTRETTDNKGNRKIEVIIGDMVANEVTRTGSSTQQAMTSTFGNRPVLARR